MSGYDFIRHLSFYLKSLIVASLIRNILVRLENFPESAAYYFKVRFSPFQDNQSGEFSQRPKKKLTSSPFQRMVRFPAFSEEVRPDQYTIYCQIDL